MKNVILSLMIVVGFAPRAFAEAETFLVCKEIVAGENTPRRTMTLRQIGAGSVAEGENIRFEFHMYPPYEAQPIVSMPVNVTQVDVLVNFVSDDQSLRGLVVKGELDQTAVSYQGEDIGFDCN